VIPLVIDMMNSVHSLPTNLPTDITDGIYSVGNSVGKNGTSSFFFFALFYFFPSVFPFVLIDFLVVFQNYQKNIKKYQFNIFQEKCFLKKILKNISYHFSKWV